MKKLIALAIVLLGLSSISFAEEKKEKKSEAQFIITDCGTVHQIPDNSSVKFACDMVDKWSKLDCKQESTTRT